MTAKEKIPSKNLQLNSRTILKEQNFFPQPQVVRFLKRKQKQALGEESDRKIEEIRSFLGCCGNSFLVLKFLFFVPKFFKKI